MSFTDREAMDLITEFYHAHNGRPYEAMREEIRASIPRLATWLQPYVQDTLDKEPFVPRSGTGWAFALLNTRECLVTHPLGSSWACPMCTYESGTFGLCQHVCKDYPAREAE